MTSEEQDRRRIRRALRADLYTPNPELERVLRHPELLDQMSPSDAASIRLQLAYYEEDRRAATSSDEEYDSGNEAA